MIIDDEPDVVNSVKRVLQRWNYEVDAFTDPKQALAQFEKTPADYSLVMTDVRMPGMTGLELTSAMLKIKPEIKISLMTALETVPIGQEQLLTLLRWEDALHKPLGVSQICQEVKRQLA